MELGWCTVDSPAGPGERAGLGARDLSSAPAAWPDYTQLTGPHTSTCSLRAAKWTESVSQDPGQCTASIQAGDPKKPQEGRPQSPMCPVLTAVPAPLHGLCVLSEVLGPPPCSAG